MISTLSLLRFALAGHKKADVSVMQKGQPTYTCPNGFELLGEKCVRFKSEALIPVCEDGLLRQQNKEAVCLMSVAPREICPEGFVDDGLVCARWETRAPTTSCPMGFDLVSDKKKSAHCEKPIKIAGPLVCPQGTVDDGKSCVQYSYVTPMWSCQNGTVQDGKFCATYEDYDCTQPNFPSKKKHHLRMLKPKKDDAIIELGKGRVESVVEIKSKCRRTNYAPAIAECPPGTFSEGKKCKIVKNFNRQPTNPILTFETADMNSTCPSGFGWCPETKKHYFGGGKKGHMCCFVEEKMRLLTCDSGYVLDGNNCSAYEKPLYICKNGYKKSHKKKDCSMLEYREPLVTGKMSYTCEGKDCGGHH